MASSGGVSRCWSALGALWRSIVRTQRLSRRQGASGRGPLLGGVRDDDILPVARESGTRPWWSQSHVQR